MAGSVNPKVGPTWVVVGDAAGSINPFNGEGIDYAYETGPHGGRAARRGAGHRRRACALQRYPQLLEAEYGLYFKVARLFAKVIGQPALMRAADPGRACSPARSWSGCCASWRTCSAPTSSARPRPPTRWPRAVVRLVPEPGA